MRFDNENKWGKVFTLQKQSCFDHRVQEYPEVIFTAGLNHKWNNLSWSHKSQSVEQLHGQLLSYRDGGMFENQPPINSTVSKVRPRNEVWSEEPDLPAVATSR